MTRDIPSFLAFLIVGPDYIMRLAQEIGRPKQMRLESLPMRHTDVLRLLATFTELRNNRIQIKLLFNWLRKFPVSSQLWLSKSRFCGLFCPLYVPGIF